MCDVVQGAEGCVRPHRAFRRGNELTALPASFGQLMALKELNTNDQEHRHQLINELRALCQCSSDHLVKMYDAFFHEGSVYIALEFCDRGSLEDVIEDVRQHEGRMQEQVIPIWSLSDPHRR